MLPSFSYHLLRLMWGSGVGVDRHVCLGCIAESKTRSEQKRVIQPDQDVQVCGLFLVIHGWTPFAWLFLPLLFSIVSYQHFFWHAFASMWHTFFGYASFLFSFFWHTPWECGLPSLGRHLLFSFCIAQVVLESKVIEFLFLWMDVATISQCGSIVCVRDLDKESMTSF